MHSERDMPKHDKDKDARSPGDTKGPRREFSSPEWDDESPLAEALRKEGVAGDGGAKKESAEDDLTQKADAATEAVRKKMAKRQKTSQRAETTEGTAEEASETWQGKPVAPEKLTEPAYQAAQGVKKDIAGRHPTERSEKQRALEAELQDEAFLDSLTPEQRRRYESAAQRAHEHKDQEAQRMHDAAVLERTRRRGGDAGEPLTDAGKEAEDVSQVENALSAERRKNESGLALRDNPESALALREDPSEETTTEAEELEVSSRGFATALQESIRDSYRVVRNIRDATYVMFSGNEHGGDRAVPGGDASSQSLGKTRKVGGRALGFVAATIAAPLVIGGYLSWRMLIRPLIDGTAARWVSKKTGAKIPAWAEKSFSRWQKKEKK